MEMLGKETCAEISKTYTERNDTTQGIWVATLHRDQMKQEIRLTAVKLHTRGRPCCPKSILRAIDPWHKTKLLVEWSTHPFNTCDSFFPGTLQLTHARPRMVPQEEGRAKGHCNCTAKFWRDAVHHRFALHICTVGFPIRTVPTHTQLCL